MKRCALGVCLFALVGSLALAGEIVPSAIPLPAGLVTVGGPGISAENCQGNDNENLASGSVACSSDAGVTVRENGHARRWVVPNATQVAEVRYGVEDCRDATGQGRPCDVQVRLWSAPNFPTFGGAVELAQVVDNVPDGTALEIRTVQFPNVAVPANTNLVVELYNPDWNANWGFFPGSNAGGQSAPSYIRSAPCALANWGDLGGVGFPNVHLLICWSDQGGGGLEGCIYKASKNSKAKGGCQTCPQKNDLFSSGVACQGPNNCTAKVKNLTIDCPGGDGSCTKVKGKRVECVP